MPDLSREIHRFPPSDPGSDPIHIGVMYPNTYAVAVASLGFQIIHLLAHSHPGVVTHRIVLEKANGTDYPARTLEENLAIKSLDAILISVSFELDYLHLVRMLDAAGIPVLQKKRGSLPLIIIGGIAPTANPEPLALIADAICIGKAELILPRILDDIQEAYPLLQGARFREGRDHLYGLWDQRDGVYVPSLNKHRINHVSIDNPDDYPSYTPVISPDGVYGTKNLIEVSSGCPAGCRFCLLSYAFPAGREMSPGKILENARIFEPGIASVGLISSRISDHPDIVKIIDTLVDEGYGVSVSSLRMATTSPELLESLARAGARSVTFAPEHGSEKIRDVIHKPYTYDEVREKIASAFDSGISRVKLYFLTGFAEETDEDLDATSGFILSLIDDIGLANRPVDNRLVIGLAAFVPKPATPFQRRPMQDEQTLKRRMKRILNPLKNLPRIELESESPRMSLIQGMLSIADRSIAEHLDDIAHTRGSLASSWDDTLRKIGDNPKSEVLQTRDGGVILPWSFINRPKRGLDHD